MTPINTDKSNPALQQSQRWKHRAVFRAGSLPPLHALSQPSRRLHKPWWPRQSRGVQPQPSQRRFWSLSGEGGGCEGPEDPYGCSRSRCCVLAVATLALEREAASPSTQTRPLPAADLDPGGSVSDVCLG